jgi:adenosylcobinamide-GDP ribazoletransferase
MLRGFVVATRFLTRVPMPGRAVEVHELAPAAAWFPLIGALVGGVTAATIVYTQPRLGASSIVLGLIVAALLTGCFHEDGLADACDGLGGGFTRERALAIMRDSRIGSYGAIALVLLYLARFTLFAQLGRPLLVILPAAAALGRGTSIALMAWLPNARAEGVAEEVSRDLRPWTVIVGITLTIALAAIAWPLALPMLGVAAAITLLAGLYLRHRLGGITGDTLGAVNVIVEVASLAIAQVLK